MGGRQGVEPESRHSDEIITQERKRRPDGHEWTSDETECCPSWLDVSRENKTWKFYSKAVS